MNEDLWDIRFGNWGISLKVFLWIFPSFSWGIWGYVMCTNIWWIINCDSCCWGHYGKIDQSDYKKQALNFVKILSFLLALFLSSRLVGVSVSCSIIGYFCLSWDHGNRGGSVKWAKDREKKIHLYFHVIHVVENKIRDFLTLEWWLFQKAASLGTWWSFVMVKTTWQVLLLFYRTIMSSQC